MEYQRIREIIHVNTDDFYASVIRIKDPSLRRRPVVVGYLSGRGAVVAASYEARETGVRPGVTTSQARRLCPEAAFVQADWNLFRRASGALFSVVDRYSPLVEPAGLDEGFLDYTGCAALFGAARDTAWSLQREIAKRFSLSISLGLGANKLVSRIASRAAKRGGLVDVPPGTERQFLAGFPVGWLPGVGEAWSATFAALGVATIGTLADIPDPLVAHVFGSRGRVLAVRARGIDNRPVVPGNGRQALERVEAHVTFEDDVICADYLDAQLYALAEQLGRKLRRLAGGARRIDLRLTYTDGYCAAHAASMPQPTALDRDIYREARVLLKRAFNRRVKVRALSLAVPSAAPFVEQGDLFLPERRKLAGLYQACDAIRDKHGEGRILQFGKTFRYSSQR
ncbi:MAG: DNA polymerase IV [Chitinivibrionia bacterium]|nr:DNA polymerase IV [Chitinivibrionia bacterium]